MQEVAIRFSASAGIVVQISSTGLQVLSHCPKRKTRPIRGNLSPGDAVCRNEQLANRLKSSRKPASSTQPYSGQRMAAQGDYTSKCIA